jgi:rubrerythrin
MDLEKAIQGEIDTAYLYQQMVNLLKDPELQKFYGQMAAIEKKHIQKFYEKIVLSNPNFKIREPSGRAKNYCLAG